jgi:hypothetical protein
LCGLCAKSGTGGWRAEGGRRVEDRFNTGKMTVLHTVPVSALLQTVEKIGYRAEVLEKEGQSPCVSGEILSELFCTA